MWAAADLESGYKVLERDAPDVVLLDINLGAANGLDLLTWMRSKSRLDDVPVIAVTAHALASEQERILKAGCAACLSKPIDLKELQEQLRRWLQFRAVAQQRS